MHSSDSAAVLLASHPFSWRGVGYECVFSFGSLLHHTPSPLPAQVKCMGQSVALVLADTFQHALDASRAVVVTVTAPAAAPIFTIADAVAAKSFLLEVC
jgi:hypothetical protein